MARARRGGGGGGGMFSRSKPAPAPTKRAPAPQPPAPAPAAAPPAPMQQSSGGGMLSGLAGTVAQGMAFGTGSAIAHRAVGAVAGSLSGGEAAPSGGVPADMAAQAQPVNQMQQGGACAQDKTMFYECLQQNRGDQQSCAFLYDMLKECQRNNGEMFN